MPAKRPSLVLILAALAAPPLATAQGVRPVSSGAFSAMEVPTTDVKRFIAEWDRPGARADIHIDDKIPRGGSITPFIVFKGCAVDAKGACDVAAEVSFVDPAGKVTGPAQIQVISGPPAPGPGVFMRSQAAPSFSFDATDPVGRYLLRARVTDRVAHATVELEQAVTYGP